MKFKPGDLVVVKPGTRYYDQFRYWKGPLRIRSRYEAQSGMWNEITTQEYTNSYQDKDLILVFSLKDLIELCEGHEV